MKKKEIQKIFILGIALLVSACGGMTSEVGDSPMEVEAAKAEADTLSKEGVYADGVFRIVGTTTQAFDILTILTEGVEDVEIVPLMGAGVDPHLYQPTESDIAAMNSADMVVYNGLFLEGQFDTVFEALREQGVTIYALSKPVKDGGFTIGGFELNHQRPGGCAGRGRSGTFGNIYRTRRPLWRTNAVAF